MSRARPPKQHALLTQLAALAATELTAEALLHKIMETLTQWGKRNLVDDLTHEGKLQQQAGFLDRDATLLHVEQGGIVELAHGAAMRALHVVGVNLKHGLRVHSCLASHAEVLVPFLRSRLLTAVAHQHATGKGTYGLVVEYIFV